MTGDALVGPGRNHEPDPLVRLATELRDLRRYVDDKSAQILRTAGLRAMPDALTVEGALNVTGPMVVGGTLSLPAGIIGNDALASPVVPAQFYQTGAAGVPLPTSTWVTVASQTITVPTGFTKVLVIANAVTAATGSSLVELDAHIIIQGVLGPDGTSSSYYVTATPLTQLITGLVAGGTFSVLEQTRAIGPGSYSTTMAVVEGALIWFR